jgi:S1-C subfamily serine protease
MNFIYRVAIGFVTTSIAVIQSQPIWAQNALAIEDVAKQITVLISFNLLGGKNFTETASGVIVKGSDGNYYVVSNAHVLKNNSNFGYRATVFSLNPLEIPSEQRLQIIGVLDENKTDLALARFVNQKNNYNAAELGDATSLKNGDPVYVAGFPGVVPGIVQGINFQFTLLKISSQTPIRAGEPIIYTPIQPDKNVEPGQSGGPVLNQSGELVGIHRGLQTDETKGDGISVNVILSNFTQLQPSRNINSVPSSVPSPVPNPVPSPIPSPAPTRPVRGLY